MELIEIEGKFYQEKSKNQATKAVSQKTLGLIALAQTMHNMSFGGSNYSRQRPSVNLIEEFRLIQQKKSKLSRSDRDWVERMFHKNYKEVNDK